MKTETNNGITTISASTGKIFRRIHDGLEMSDMVVLGIDHSTGTPRPDMAEYYEEINNPEESEPISPDVTNKYVITAPKALIAMYPELLFDLAVRRKLPMVESGDNVLIYCNWIDPDHQALIDNSNGMITISEN